MNLRALIAFGALMALGTLLDRWLTVAPQAHPIRFPIRLLTALALAYVAWALPGIVVPLLVASAGTRRASSAFSPTAPAPASSHAHASHTRFDKPLLGLACAAALWMLARPPTPVLWDEFVWLAKARMEAAAPGTLVSETLRPGSAAIPAGYPVLAPLACALLAGLDPATDALMRAANVLTGIALVTFGLTVRAAFPWVRARTLAALALAAPLVLVHVRAAYVDITVGLLAASLVLLLADGHLRAACVVALMLSGLKDEGTVHVLAISCAAAVMSARHRGPRARASALLPAGIALLSAVAWGARVTLAGLGIRDHALSFPRAARVPLIVEALARDAGDVWSWGGLWIVVAAIAASRLIRRRGPEEERVIASALVLQGLGLTAGLVLGPDRLMEFVLGGSVVNRMLVQLAPMAILLVLSSGAPQDPGPRPPGERSRLSASPSAHPSP